MKKSILTLGCLLFVIHFSFAQAPLAKQWDHTFGGTDWETLTVLKQTADSGFILGGYTRSDSGADVSQPAQGFWDYWIVKTDSLGNKQWDKRFGGSGNDKLNAVVQTTDHGYMLGGFSSSDSTGDVSHHTNGSIDFWIVKTDSLGNKLWDKMLGGSQYDVLNALQQTSDGGYIFGGYSYSDSSGDVSENSRGGEDYWIIKTDSAGNKQWDKRFGGNITDELFALQQTTDGGYILGGKTISDSSGDISQVSRGSYDYWIVKTDQTGNKLWDSRLGGDGKDVFVSLQQTTDGGFILGGYTVSDSSFEVSEPTRDSSLTAVRRGDAWIVKTDSLGAKQWDKRFGGVSVEDAFGYVKQTSDGGYLMGCASYSGASGDKTDNNFGMEQSWIVKTDSAGNKLWDKTIYTNGEDEYAYPIQTFDGCYVIANWSYSDSSGYKTENSRGNYDFWFVKFCETSVPQLPVANFTTLNSATCASGCFDFINLSFDAGSFQWLFPGATPSSSTLAEPTGICYADSGHYTVTLIATNASGSDTLVMNDFIVVHPLPSFTINLNADSLLAPQGYSTYQWYQGSNPIAGATNYFTVINQNDTFSVQVTDTNGCPGSQTIVITSFGMPSASFTANDTTICEGGCVNFLNSSFNATSYQWLFAGAVTGSDTATNPQNICYNTNGTFAVTLISTNSLGSDTTHGTITVYPLPATFTITHNVDSLFAPSTFAHYQWYLNTVALANDTNYLLGATASGNYTVLVTDSNGCQVNSAILNVNVGISELSSSGFGISVFPDPAGEEINFSFAGVSGTAKLSVMNAVGQEVFSKTLTENERQHVRLANKFSAGVYTVVLKDAKAVHTKRFVVQ